MVYEAWHGDDTERVLDLLHPEFEWVNPDHAVDPGIRRGHDGYRAVIANLRSTFAEQDHEILEMRDLGECVLCHTVFRARGHSGAEIEVPEQHVWTIRVGKIVRLQWFHDADEAQRAAGLPPSVQ